MPLIEKDAGKLQIVTPIETSSASPRAEVSTKKTLTQGTHKIGRSLSKQKAKETSADPRNLHKDITDENAPSNEMPSNRSIVSPSKAEETVEEKPLPATRTTFVGILLSALIIIGSIGYAAASVLCAFDKKGREAYFAEKLDTELPLVFALKFKVTAPTWTLKTDDWGWIQRASENLDSFWKNYDVFYAVLIVGIVCSLYWLVSGIFELLKYKREDANAAKCV